MELYHLSREARDIANLLLLVPSLNLASYEGEGHGLRKSTKGRL